MAARRQAGERGVKTQLAPRSRECGRGLGVARRGAKAAAGSKRGARWARRVRRGQILSRWPGRLGHRFGGVRARRALPDAHPHSRAGAGACQRSTRLRHRPAARRISAAVCTGAGKVWSRVTVWEALEAQLDADRTSPEKPPAGEVGGELLTQLVEDAAEHGAVAHSVQVALERRLAADGDGLLCG